MVFLTIKCKLLQYHFMHANHGQLELASPLEKSTSGALHAAHSMSHTLAWLRFLCFSVHQAIL